MAFTKSMFKLLENFQKFALTKGLTGQPTGRWTERDVDDSYPDKKIIFAGQN